MAISPPILLANIGVRASIDMTNLHVFAKVSRLVRSAPQGQLLSYVSHYTERVVQVREIRHQISPRVSSAPLSKYVTVYLQT